MSALCTELFKKKKKEESLKKELQCLDIYELSKKKIRKMCRACSFLYKIFLIKDCFANKVLPLLVLHVSLTIILQNICCLTDIFLLYLL